MGINPEYQFSLQTKYDANLKMFQSREGGVGIHVSILKKTVSVVTLRETFYLNKHLDTLAKSLFHLCKVTLLNFWLDRYRFLETRS